MAETLLQALFNIQRKAPKAQEDGLNDYTESRYMQLKTVYEKVLPLLSEEEILWQTRPCADEHGRPALRYTLTHVPSKESIEEVMPLMLEKGTPQAQGSAITYARRYALVAALNLVADKDDDGHEATAQAAALPANTEGPEVGSPPTVEEQTDLRQTISDLATKLKEFEVEWTQTEEWAKQRGIDLGSPPADKLRAVERALRSKLDRTTAEHAKKADKPKS